MQIAFLRYEGFAPLDAAHPDIVVVPGSVPTFRDMARHRPTLAWPRQVSGARYITAVCTGSPLLAAAGLLG
jgi:putative intracellular protease/amidase